MLNKLVCFAFLFFVICFGALSQEKCNCCSAEQRAFDFWVGEWSVSDTAGNKLGENSITKLESGCILNERWKGKSGYSGSSYNYYDKADSTWNQLWIDFKGSNLKLKGNIQGKRMILKSELKTSPKGIEYYDQISWIKQSDDEVIQLWETYSPEGKKLGLLFKGVYKRK